jgi:hypothetical protein
MVRTTLAGLPAGAESALDRPRFRTLESDKGADKGADRENTRTIKRNDINDMLIEYSGW